MSILAKVLVTLTLFSAFSFSVFSWADEQLPFGIEAMSAQQAYQKGNLLRAQFKDKQALGYLKYAADKGYDQAQYLYGMTLYDFHPTSRNIPEAKKYLLEASHQGNLKAMQVLVLSNILPRTQRFEMLHEYENKLKALLKTNPSDANFYLYQLSSKMNKGEDAESYLSKAIELEHPQAMFSKALLIQQGEGFYFSDSNRLEDANVWLTKSANKGYIPAYRQLIKNLEAQDDFETAFAWREKLLQQGDLLSLSSMGNILLGNGNSAYLEYENKELGLSYLGLYLKYAGKDRMTHLYQTRNVDFNQGLKRLTHVEKSDLTNMLEYKLENVRFYNFDSHYSY